MSSKILHLVLVIVLAYVCVLNAVIVNVFYKRYLQNKQVVVPAPFVRLRNSTRPRREPVLPPSCTGEEERALAVVTSSQEHSNDPSRATALPQLRHALRVGDPQLRKVFLVATSDTFISSHRAWCHALYVQTQKKASCQLLLLPTPMDTIHVFQAVMEQLPCVSDLVILPDTVQVKPSLFTRLEHTVRGRVTCLVAETTKKHGCPVRAFRVPRLFLEAYTGETEVETAARGMHMYAGGAAVVGLG